MLLSVTFSTAFSEEESLLNLFNGQHCTEWNYMMAASTISILPTAILTVALQKYIIEGISISGFGGR